MLNIELINMYWMLRTDVEHIVHGPKIIEKYHMESFICKSIKGILYYYWNNIEQQFNRNNETRKAHSAINERNQQINDDK